MKGRATQYSWGETIVIELTERNLRTLLLKLDREDSARMLYQDDPATGRRYVVQAVPDKEHYSDRAPGGVHPAEEARL